MNHKATTLRRLELCRGNKNFFPAEIFQMESCVYIHRDNLGKTRLA